jgi:hypothetical protein
VADDPAAGLVRWLNEHGVEAEVEVVGRATVGLSQETWFVRLAVEGEPAVDGVLRLPTAASGARAIKTQRVALQAVAGSAVPAPELLTLVLSLTLAFAIWHGDWRLQAAVVRRDQTAVDEARARLRVGEGGDDGELVGVGEPEIEPPVPVAIRREPFVGTRRARERGIPHARVHLIAAGADAGPDSRHEV